MITFEWPLMPFLFKVNMNQNDTTLHLRKVYIIYLKHQYLVKTLHLDIENIRNKKFIGIQKQYPIMLLGYVLIYLIEYLCKIFKMKDD